MTVSRETRTQQYLDLLVRWNATINLSSSTTADHSGFQAHIEDSLTLVDHLPPGLIRLIDLGSGQGFPAIPVAIATGIRIDMIEADRRKAAFLTTALAALGLNGTVIRSRIEQAIITPAACVTARALAPLPKLIVLAERHVAAGGCCLLLKGPAASDEVAEAARTEAAGGRAVNMTVLPTHSARCNLVKISFLR